MGNQVDYEQNALLYAERYGVIEYTVEDNKMTYFEKFNEGRGVTAVYCAEVNLDTMKEERNQIK